MISLLKKTKQPQPLKSETQESSEQRRLVIGIIRNSVFSEDAKNKGMSVKIINASVDKDTIRCEMLVSCAGCGRTYRVEGVYPVTHLMRSGVLLEEKDGSFFFDPTVTLHPIDSIGAYDHLCDHGVPLEKRKDILAEVFGAVH